MIPAILSLCLVASWNLAVEDPYEELKKITELYRSEDYMSLQAKYYYYEGFQSEKPTDSLLMDLYKKGKEFYMRSDEAEVLQSTKMNIVIDHESREIIIQQNSGSTLPGFDFENFRLMANNQGLKLRWSDLGKGRALIRFSAPEHSKTLMEIVYDRKTYLVQRTLLAVSVEDASYLPDPDQNNMKLETFFSNYKQVGKAIPISPEDILVKGKNGYIPVNRLKGYQIIQ